MLKTAADEGITDIIATPHFREDKPCATPMKIEEKIREVQNTAREQGISVRLYPGNEIMYFSELPRYLREGHVCTLNGSRSVLIEFLPNIQFRSMQNAANNILTAGYLPVLAHAERYACLMQNEEYLEFLRDIGVQIQVNAASVTGKNGMEAKRFAVRLLKAEMADYIGTDAHSSRHRTPAIAKCRETIIKKYGRQYAKSLLRDRAKYQFGIEAWPREEKYTYAK